jgi:ABC-type phosphate transport system substrate-binding protein
LPLQIPELLEKGTLVLTLEILADIYLGNISNWRDRRILENNQHIADSIPDQPIIVIVPTVCTTGHLLC